MKAMFMAVSAPVECGFGSLFKRAVSSAECAVSVAMAKILPNLFPLALDFNGDNKNIPVHECNCKPACRIQESVREVDERSSQWSACHHLRESVHDASDDSSRDAIADGSS